MQHDTLMGIALGAPHEATGLVLLERIEELGPWNKARKLYDVIPKYRVAGVHRVPRSEGYGSTARAAQELWPTLELRKHATEKSRDIIVANVSKAGRAALEPMRDLGLHPVPVDVTGIVGGKPDKRSYQIGAPELTAASVVVQEEKRITMAPDVDARELAEQLRAARLKADGVELADALALALWWSEMKWRARLAQPRPPRQALAEAIEKACRPPTFNQVLEMAKKRRAA